MLSVFRRTTGLCSVILWLGMVDLAYSVDSNTGALRQAEYGETYYTQFSLFHYHYIHETTNYRRTTLIPINTPVTFDRVRITDLGHGGNRGVMVLSKPEIIVKLPEGKELHIVNIKKYSGEDLERIFTRTLGKEKVDLSLFTALERTNILEGEVQIGMSKAAVIRAMGYPPKHRTPSLSSDQWTYWSSRMGSFVVRFRDDKVISVN
jgi:hypothetical protein